MDELEAWTKIKREIKETCILAFTEMWLSDSDRDEDLFLSGFGSPLRLDRSPGREEEEASVFFNLPEVL